MSSSLYIVRSLQSVTIFSVIVMFRLALEQGSLVWNNLREENQQGYLSASNLAKVLGLEGSRNKELEIYLGYKKRDSFDNIHMRYGREEEEPARKLYEQLRGVTVKKIGTGSYWKRDPRFLASPDGLFRDIDGDLKGLEIKNPSTNAIPFAITQIDIKYYPQVMANQEVWEIDTWHLFFCRRRTNEYSLFQFQRNSAFWESDIWPIVEEFKARKCSFDRVNSREKKQLIQRIKSAVKVELLDHCAGISED